VQSPADRLPGGSDRECEDAGYARYHASTCGRECSRKLFGFNRIAAPPPYVSGALMKQSMLELQT